MILINKSVWANRARLAPLKLSRILATLVLILLIQGCTNSKLIISPLYNRLDDQMRSEFNEMGDFTDEQKAAFDQQLGTFHVWHRRSELPLYADLMQQIASSIAQSDIDSATLQRWMNQVETSSQNLRQCLPINFSFDLMKSLSDEQVNEIETRYFEERQERREQYGKRTREEQIDRRIRNVIKWAGRIDVEVTATQRAMLLTAFKQQRSLREEYRVLSDEWYRQFFVLAKQRDKPNFDTDMSAHLKELGGLLEKAHPEQWQANRDLWMNTMLRVADSLTDKQRTTLSRWLNKMARTVLSISKDEPSFKVINDPSLGCLVDSDEA